MARRFLCGFEWNATDGREVSLPNPATGTNPPTIDAAIKRSGTYALKLNPPSGGSSRYDVYSIACAYIRYYVRVTALPTSLSRMLSGDLGSFNTFVNVSSTGALELYEGGSAPYTLIGTSTTKLTDTTKWYRIELRSGTASLAPILRIDGVDEITGTAGSTLNAFPAFGPGVTEADTYTAYIDDVAGDDADWVGDSQIVLLRPTSDNASGGWTGGAGGTTNLWDAVDNLPAVGKATANQTNTTNIENAVSSTTDNCDFNLTTYTTAGVPSGSTILSVQAHCRHGEDVATGTKTGALQIVSNPAQSGEDAFTFGNDAGAAVDEYSTTWKNTLGTMQASPSVTLGTAPVVRVGKRTATTRVVLIDAVGMYVEYVAAAAATSLLPPPQPMAHMIVR